MTIAIFILTVLIYALTHQGEGAHYNYFVFLADAFLNGRLNILEHPSWLNELVSWQGKYYLVLPPMPGILLIPFVLLFGTSFYQPVLSFIIGGLNASLCYMFMHKYTKKSILAIWLSIFYAFGTIEWYHAQVGSAWYLALIISQAFVWLMLIEAITKRRLLLMGLLIGGAYLTRLPVIFAAIFVFIYLNRQFFEKTKSIPFLLIKPKPILTFVLGIGAAVIINSLYNYFRFGSFLDIGYYILLRNDPSHPLGLINLGYIPVHIWEMLTAMPIFIDKAPFVIPSLNIMALWLVCPAIILFLFAKFGQRIVLASIFAIIFIALGSLIKGGNGYTQFGPRYSLDYTPFLMIMIASAMTIKFKWWMKALILLSIIINLWGVLMISFFNQWRI